MWSAEGVPDMRYDHCVTVLCGCDVFLDGKLVMPAKLCPWMEHHKQQVLQAEARGATGEVDALREEIRRHYAERGFELYVPPAEG